jgi:Tol biopolymer transport system component
LQGVDFKELPINKKVAISAVAVVVVALVFATLYANNRPSSENNELIHDHKWGIYVLDLQTQKTELVYSSQNKMSRIRLDNTGTRLVFSQEIRTEHIDESSPVNLGEEICSINVDGTNYKQITDNHVWELIPCWSEDGSEIFYLAFNQTLDIFKMNSDGSNVSLVYDSGVHDSDMSCADGKVAFTRDSQIWVINTDGTAPVQVTDPPRAAEWGQAVLPFGDYDPNLSPDGSKIVFERMVDDKTTHGNYDIYVIKTDGTQETAITDSGYTQGIASWSHSGTRIVYMVSAMGNEAKYDIYTMNSDGTNNQNVTPNNFPADFLCHDPVFSEDDTQVYFIGEWYND